MTDERAHPYSEDYIRQVAGELGIDPNNPSFRRAVEGGLKLETVGKLSAEIKHYVNNTLTFIALPETSPKSRIELRRKFIEGMDEAVNTCQRRDDTVDRQQVRELLDEVRQQPRWTRSDAKRIQGQFLKLIHSNTSEE